MALYTTAWLEEPDDIKQPDKAVRLLVRKGKEQEVIFFFNELIEKEKRLYQDYSLGPGKGFWLEDVDGKALLLDQVMAMAGQSLIHERMYFCMLSCFRNGGSVSYHYEEILDIFAEYLEDAKIGVSQDSPDGEPYVFILSIQNGKVDEVW